MPQRYIKALLLSIVLLIITGCSSILNILNPGPKRYEHRETTVTFFGGTDDCSPANYTYKPDTPNRLYITRIGNNLQLEIIDEQNHSTYTRAEMNTGSGIVNSDASLNSTTGVIEYNGAGTKVTISAGASELRFTQTIAKPPECPKGWRNDVSVYAACCSGTKDRDDNRRSVALAVTASVGNETDLYQETESLLLDYDILAKEGANSRTITLTFTDTLQTTNTITGTLVANSGGQEFMNLSKLEEEIIPKLETPQYGDSMGGDAPDSEGKSIQQITQDNTKTEQDNTTTEAEIVRLADENIRFGGVGMSNEVRLSIDTSKNQLLSQKQALQNLTPKTDTRYKKSLQKYNEALYSFNATLHAYLEEIRNYNSQLVALVSSSQMRLIHELIDEFAAGDNLTRYFETAK